MSNFICPDCGKRYYYNRNLTQHIRKVHPLRQCEEISEDPCIHRCNLCEKSYPRSSRLRKHERKVHGIANYSRAMSCKCPLCEFRCYERNYLHEHFSAKHKLKLEFEDFTFSSFDEFKVWKENIEQETNARFVKISGVKKRSNCTTTYFYCHRSGNFVTKSKGYRQLKSQGSNKINGCCPACIRLNIPVDGQYNVRYIKTHVGHENSVDHLSFTSAERDMLAAKIAAKVPFDAILNEIHTSASDNERLRLLKRKDLHNIEIQYKLNAHTEDNENDEHDMSIARKLKAISIRHKASHFLKTDIILSDANGWKISYASSNENITHTVRLTNKNCNCELVCKECNSCVHKYSCTCFDSIENGTMCEHIHLICQLTNSPTNISSDCSDHKLIIRDQEDQLIQPQNQICISDSEVILEELSENAIEVETNEDIESLLILRKKENLKKEFGEIIDNISMSSALDVVKNFLVSLKVVIANHCSNTNVNLVVSNNSNL